MIFLYLFYTFFKIGLFGFGGGYAMLSLIQGEVVTRYHWINAGEFTDIVAISHMTPVLPSFLLMLTISKFFLKYQKHPAVEAVFSGLRPAVVGLLAAAALVLMNKENFGSYKVDWYQFIISIIIFLAAFFGTRKYKINPILMIILCGLAGFLLY